MLVINRVLRCDQSVEAVTAASSPQCMCVCTLDSHACLWTGTHMRACVINERSHAGSHIFPHACTHTRMYTYIHTNACVCCTPLLLARHETCMCKCGCNESGSEGDQFPCNQHQSCSKHQNMLYRCISCMFMCDVHVQINSSSRAVRLTLPEYGNA